MKYITLLFIITLSSQIMADAKSIKLCNSISVLQKDVSRTESPQSLMEMGNLASQIEIEPEIFRKDQKYKTLCHLKIVKSDNFGDFISYDGYHYQKILTDYPHSQLADDAAFALIYVITEDVYNFSDTRREKAKLLAFIKRYPKSNKLKEAKARIKEIDTALKNGDSPILD
jgi:hypothetical protein